MSRDSALSWPKRERWSGTTYWLSRGQRSLLFWIESRLAKGHHAFTLDQAAAAVGLDRSNISRGLDRLASLNLIGRKSRPGRGRRTVVWHVGETRALADRARHASTQPARNVATSTPYGGYLSREALAVAGGSTGRGFRSARRLAPPRLLYARCPAGHRVRLARWHVRRSPDGSRIDGTWKGWCRRCAAFHSESLVMELPADDRGGLSERRRARANAVDAGRLDRDAFREAEDADHRRSPAVPSLRQVAARWPGVVDSRAAPGSGGHERPAGSRGP